MYLINTIRLIEFYLKERNSFLLLVILYTIYP
nr:MAG TPA: hypothetical protein [Caudoviricetes sp.]